MAPSIPTSRSTDKREDEPNRDDDVAPIVSSVRIPNPEPSEGDLKLSKKRWFVLFAIAIFGLSLAASGDCSSIFNVLLDLLDLKVDQYLYISQIFHYLALVLMGPTAIFVDKFGIRATTHAAVCFFVITGLFKTLLYFTRLPGWSTNKMYYYLASNFFGTETFLLFILLPLKVSETWFSVSERSVAWTTLMLQADVGALISSFVYPRLIKKADDFKLLAYIYIVSISVTTVSCVACVTRSAPDHHPSLRMAEASKDDKSPLLVSLKKLIQHKDLLLHSIHGGVFGAINYTISTIFQDILVSIGLSPIFGGNYMSINAIVAIIMLLTMSTFVHKVDNPLLACKLGSFGQSALLVALLVSLKMAAPGWVIILAGVCLTICKSFTSPHFNNITAHMACGTVSQATIVGFSLLVATIIMSVIQSSFAYLIQTHNHDAKSKYDQAFMLMGIITLINEVIYLMFFQGKTAAKFVATVGGGGGGEQAAVDNLAYEQERRESAAL